MIDQLNIEELAEYGTGLTGYAYSIELSGTVAQLDLKKSAKEMSKLMFEFESYDNDQVRVSAKEKRPDNTTYTVGSEVVTASTDDVKRKMNDLYRNW